MSKGYIIDVAGLTLCEYSMLSLRAYICIMQHYTFCILLIENSMRMHRVVPGCKVLQMDHNDIINLSSQYGTEEAQPGRMGDLAAVRSICVLSEHGLLINAANTVGSSFQEDRCMPEIQWETGKCVNKGIKEEEEEGEGQGQVIVKSYSKGLHNCRQFNLLMVLHAYFCK